MISAERKDQLFRWSDVAYHSGYTLKDALARMAIRDREELDLVCRIWGEQDIDKLNLALGYS